MHYLFIVYSMACLAVSDAFFFYAAKHDRWFFCFKICPLYCSPRRYDEDVAASVYVEDQVPFPYPYFEDDHVEAYPPPHYPHVRYIYCKPKPTTTTPKPTTTTPPTTPEPSGICMLCNKKCGYF